MNVDPFFSRLNPLICWVLRSPLHFLASGGLALLTITGRRTRREYSIPVGYQREENELVVMVSHAHTKNWWRNFLDPYPLDVLLRGQSRHGLAWVVAPESPEFRERTEATFRRMPMMGAQFGIRFDRRAGLSDEQVAHLGQTCAVVRVRLDP